MTNWQLYKLIRKNDELKDLRHPMFEKNRFMKFLAWFMILYYAAIMLLMGVMLPMGMRGTYNGVAAFHVLDGGLIYFIIADFWLRFMLQETPGQQAKPYALMPIRRSFLMNVYLTRAGLSLGNLFWGFFLVPFALLAVYPLLGWSGFFGWLIGWWLLFVANGYAYLFVRTLCIKHLAWIILPIIVHGGLLLAMLWPDKNMLDMPCTLLMYNFALCHLWPFLLMAAVIALLYWINYKLQMNMVYNEVAKKEEVELKHATQMNFLNRYGALGEYLKLELKMRLRNKTVRLQFLTLLGMMVLFCVILYFTDIYDNGFMKSFICLYNYVGLGMTMLISIMCHEGNYIDGLMSRRESILQLLYAKFYFNSAVLLVPFCLLIPLMAIGKISVWMNLGYLFFTAGVLYPICFQMAVYNKETLPLNQKLASRQGNWVQQVVSIVMLFLPIAIEKLFTLLLGNPWGFIMLALLGVVGLSLHGWWLRNIYQRFMLRRYTNMEGFRASRNF